VNTRNDLGFEPLGVPKSLVPTKRVSIQQLGERKSKIKIQNHKPGNFVQAVDRDTESSYQHQLNTNIVADYHWLDVLSVKKLNC
jgi:hypothetical protein